MPYHFVETKVGDTLCEKIFVAKADPLKRITLADLRQFINAGAVKVPVQLQNLGEKPF